MAGSTKDTSDQESKVAPVSRRRRAAFVFTVVTVSFVTATAMAFMGMETAIAKMVAEKMLDLAQVMGVIYVGASAFDYSVGSGLKWGFKNRSLHVGTKR